MATAKQRKAARKNVKKAQKTRSTSRRGGRKSTSSKTSASGRGGRKKSGLRNLLGL